MMNLIQQEIVVLLKKKITIITLIVLSIGTILTGNLAIQQNARMMVNETIIENKQVVLLKQQEQKKIQGFTSNKDIQQFLKYLYLHNQTVPLTLDEKVNYLFKKENIKNIPYINLLLDIYDEENESYTSAYIALFELGKQEPNIYQDWKAKIQSYSDVSESEKLDLRRMLDTVTTPFTFETGDFIPCALSKFQDLMLLMYVTLTIMLASIFSRDRSTRTDQIILTTLQGKKQLRKARCIAGLLYSSVMFICFVLLYNFVIGVQIGVDGFSTSIQMSIYTLSPYPISAAQAYIYIILLAYMMCICITMLVLFASDRTRKAYSVIVFAFVFLFVSYMINSNGLSSKLLLFLPFSLIEKNLIFSYCNVVIAGSSLWLPWIIFSVLMFIVFVLIQRIVYRR